MTKDVQKVVFGRDSIARAIAYLRSAQSLEGAFYGLASEAHSQEGVVGGRVSGDIFFGALVTSSLRCVGGYEASAMANHCLRWLLSERDASGLWAFYGKNARLMPEGMRFPPDLDVTSCVVSAFACWGEGFDNAGIVRRLLRYRNGQGLFLTWVPDAGVWDDRLDSLEVDPIVNANVLHFCTVHGGIRLADVEEYIRKQLVSGLFEQPSLYYFSPAPFFYFVGRTLERFPDLLVGSAGSVFRATVLQLLEAEMSELDLAMTLATAKRCGLPDIKIISDGLVRLAKRQWLDGGWGSSAFFKGGPEYFGAREFTTAVALEALSLWG